jgi:hypothetical protein
VWFACNGVAVRAVSRAPLNKALGGNTRGMREFVEEYWWALAGTLITALLFATLLYSLRRPANRRRFRRNVVFAVILGAIGSGVAFIWGVSSDAYETARAYARDGPESLSRFGPVRDVSIRSFKLSSDEARYSFAVKGEKGKGVLTLFLKKDPMWRVTRVESTE